MPHSFLRGLTVLIIGLVSVPAMASENIEDAPPNILLVLADDCTWHDLGCYGGQAYTPHIDALAAQGMRFEMCFQAAPMCSPTRHNLFTGLYPVRSGAYPNHTFVREGVESVAHDLKRAGYRVALSGKSHLAPAEAFPFEWSKNPEPQVDAVEIELSSRIDFAAVDRLMADSAESGRPFALFACSDEPHGPWTKGAWFREKYDAEALELPPYFVDTPETRQTQVHYLAEISYFDAEVGRLLGMLEQHGLSDNTLVIVLSEQGHALPFGKWTLYDAGIRSGMIVRWPGKVEAGSTTPAMVEYVDVRPTLAEAAGQAPGAELEGRSLLQVLAGEALEHKEYVYALQTSRGIYNGPEHFGIRSVRDKRFKLIWNLDPDARFQNYVVRSPTFKSWQAAAEQGDAHAQAMVERHFSRSEWELYDCEADPHEMNNLAGDPGHAVTEDRLRRALQAWMSDQGDLGLETEKAAYERMLRGNNDFRAWRQSQDPADRPKEPETY